MNQVLNLLSQRRIWASLVGVLMFALGILKVTWDVDVPVLTGLLTDLGTAVSSLIMAGLALWSFIKPKENKKG